MLETSATVEQSAGKSIFHNYERVTLPSETKRYAPIIYRVKIWSFVCKEMKSEIPCRVSYDPHEWSNDGETVSTRDSAKLQDR